MALRAPSRSTTLSPISFHRPTPTDPQLGGGTTRRSDHPDWVLLHKSARIISGHRNTTTAGCHTTEGQAIEASFWLVDPPGVSYFSVHCPGLSNEDFADEPYVLCAEAALVLFSVAFVPVPRGRWISTQHFVYRAGWGSPSLHLIPDPGKVRRGDLFGLLPFAGTTGHYAVVFLNRHFTAGDKAWRFEVHAFSSVTRSWSSKAPILSGLSEDDQQSLLKHYATCKQIMVGATSLGWVDLFRGILLLCDVFGECPVVKYIPLPASRVCQTDEDGHPYIAPWYCCDNDLIKFVEIEFDDPDRRTLGNQGWKATTWDRTIAADDWRRRFTVDGANISVDPSYSDLLPAGLWNDGTGKLELKKLIFYTPTLSKHDDSFHYVMCKANNVDGKAWVITLDMEHAAVEAVAPYSTRGCLLVSWHCPCAFPKYLDLNPGDHSPFFLPMHLLLILLLVGCLSARIGVADFVLQVLLIRDWFKELDARVDFEGPIYTDCLLLLQRCPVSSLLIDIQEVVKYAFNVGRGGAAPEALALEDFEMLLRKAVGDPSSSTEAVRSKISVALRALDSILNIVPPSVRVLADAACHQKRDEATCELRERPGQTEDYKLQGSLDANLSRCKKLGHTSNDSRGKKKRARSRKANRDEQAVGLASLRQI
ncbi:hypothetical protein ACQ4PT_043417 [Festuca glaucescens]